MKFTILGIKENGGRLKYLNPQKNEEILTNAPDGQYLVSIQLLNSQSDVASYRAVYFAKIDFLGKEQGETRYDLHNLIKQEILSEMLKDLPELFNKEEDEEVSTKQLTLEGWLVLIERLDLWAFTTYNVVLP